MVRFTQQKINKLARGLIKTGILHKDGTFSFVIATKTKKVLKQYDNEKRLKTALERFLYFK